MTTALVLSCALACWRTEPPPLVRPYLELFFEQQRNNENIRRMRLETYRRNRAEIEDDIELIQEMIDTGDFPPADARELRRIQETMRQLAEETKKLERTWWEQQPGGITAPAPRPVKR